MAEIDRALPVFRLPNGAAGLELARFHSEEHIASYLCALHEARVAASSHRGVLFNVHPLNDGGAVGGVQDAATYPNDNRYPVAVGIGFDQLRNRPAGRALKEAALIGQPNIGARTTFKMRVISDSTELRTTLALSAGASVSALGGEGTGRLEIYRETNLSRFSNFVLILVTVVFEAQGIVDYKFADNKIEEDYEKNPQRFYEKYGTEFISSIVKGGELVALFEVQAETRSEYEAQKAALSINAGTWSNSDDFTRSVSLTRAFKSTRMVFTRVGTTDNVPITAETLIDYAASFPSKVANDEHAAILFFSTQSYGRIKSVEKTLDFRKPLTALANAVELRDRATILKRDWVQVTTYPQWYTTPDTARATERIQQLDDSLHRILAYAAALQNEPFEDHVVPDVNFDAVSDLPEINAGNNLALSVTILQGRKNTGGIGSPWFPMPQVSGANGQWVPDDPFVVFLDSFVVNFNRSLSGLGLEYMVHLADIGDTGYIPAGTPTPTQWHQGVAFRLTGPLAPYFTVRYRVRMAYAGESGYASDGVFCGTRGEYRAITSILVEVLKR